MPGQEGVRSGADVYVGDATAEALQLLLGDEVVAPVLGLAALDPVLDLITSVHIVSLAGPPAGVIAGAAGGLLGLALLAAILSAVARQALLGASEGWGTLLGRLLLAADAIADEALACRLIAAALTLVRGPLLDVDERPAWVAAREVEVGRAITAGVVRWRCRCTRRCTPSSCTTRTRRRSATSWSATPAVGDARVAARLRRLPRQPEARRRRAGGGDARSVSAVARRDRATVADVDLAAGRPAEGGGWSRRRPLSRCDRRGDIGVKAIAAQRGDRV